MAIRPVKRTSSNAKIIPGYKNYSITRDGRIWSMYVNNWMVVYTGKDNYIRIRLGKKSDRRNYLIHRLVLETFVGPCPYNMECRHLNGNKQDNRLSNLKWGTRSENQLDAVRHNTCGGLKAGGENNGQAKLTWYDVNTIRSLYKQDALNQYELAELYNVGQSQIHRIINYESWKCAGGVL